MKKLYLVFYVLFCANSWLSAQPNCQAYLYYGDTLKYQACTLTEEAAPYYQFSREFQQIFDRAIEVCPEYDHAYRSKSVAYLKSGDFITWKKLMDKAVELNPTEHLSYRGWCHFQFFRDYENAIKDIELLDSLVDYDIGYSQNGNYHLHIARALCYKALGNKTKALQIMETQLATKDYSPGLFDHIHLGVLYLDLGDLPKAEAAFQMQSIENELADNQYYLAMLSQQKGDTASAVQYLEKARLLYLEDKCLYDRYTHPMDKIYFKEIEQALKNIKKDG